MALITQQYDQVIKYARALQLGIVDAEQIVRRFHGAPSPRYLLDGPDLGAPGLLARHDYVPLSTMTRGVVSPGREAPVDR